MKKNAGLGDEFIKDALFPFEKIRESQKELITDIKNNLEGGKSMVLHAPTGLGKTVSVLGPCLKYAMDRNLTVFFLTSRHTQHKIAIDTLKEIKNKYRLNFTATDIIGKKWMCAVPGVTALYSGEFSEYCKSVKEDGKCEFYTRTKSKSKVTVECKQALEELEKYNPSHAENVVKRCTEQSLCPYEVATLLASKSNVIIADYNYVFNPNIRDLFFAKAQKALPESIIIVDEAHNLPSRMREQLTHVLSNFMIGRAVKEAQKFGYESAAGMLKKVQNALKKLASNTGAFAGSLEKLVKKDELIRNINEEGLNYDQTIADFEFAGVSIREEQKKSLVGSIASFLNEWKGPDEAFARILSIKDFKGKEMIALKYRCLDPSIATKQVIEESYSTIAMSGTLRPTSMYKDIMGFEDDDFEGEYESPFPKENRLNLIVPMTTTKFSARNEKMFNMIGKMTAQMTNNIPGNSIVFFPSYELRNQCYKSFSEESKRTCLIEERGLSKEEKAEMMEKFKFYKNTGAVMLAATTGSFGEGVDMPGDELIASIIVGIPLQRPDLEAREMIQYYDRKFGPQKGKFYAYFFPAINKAIQAGGRPFRSSEDRGLVVFLDERYSWPFYTQCFPPEWDLKISRQYNEVISEFFEPSQKTLGQF